MNKNQILRKLIPRGLRNWLRNPVRSLAYSWRATLGFLGKQDSLTPIPGWNIKCHPSARYHFEVFLQDPIQAAELAAFRTFCRPGMQFLDLGAHYGIMSLAAAHFGGPDSRAVAVEASPSALQVLKSNVTLNGLDGLIATLNCAVGDRDGYLEMLTTGPGGGDYFLVPNEQRSDVTRVEQKTLESILKTVEMTPSHIKIDIEGYEYEVIRQSAPYLRKLSAVLFLEIHGNYLAARNKDPRHVIDWLCEAGYTSFMFNGRELGVNDMERDGFNCRLVCQK